MMVAKYTVFALFRSFFLQYKIVLRTEINASCGKTTLGMKGQSYAFFDRPIGCIRVPNEDKPFQDCITIAIGINGSQEFQLFPCLFSFLNYTFLPPPPLFHSTYFP